MNTHDFDEFDNESEEMNDTDSPLQESTPSTKLARRRKIEDLFEEKRLKEELLEFN